MTRRWQEIRVFISHTERDSLIKVTLTEGASDE